jgi:hypothetical protein
MEKEKVSVEERFLFDLQGFVLLKNVLSPELCGELVTVLRRLEKTDYADEWIKTAPKGSWGPMRTKHVETKAVRLNGLPRLDPIFDQLIAHPAITLRLKEFMGEPQLINTWSISKEQGHAGGGWHRGLPPTHYTFRHNDIRSGMLNVVFFLTDNGPEDGCVTAIPGSHKNNIDLPWGDYKELKMPGSIPVLGKTGDVFMFSESTIHNGLTKSTGGTRTNLYYNYMHRFYDVGGFEPHNLHHFYLPPEVRERFTPEQKAMTAWMEHIRCD